MFLSFFKNYTCKHVFQNTLVSFTVQFPCCFFFLIIIIKHFFKCIIIIDDDGRALSSFTVNLSLFQWLP